MFIYGKCIWFVSCCFVRRYFGLLWYSLQLIWLLTLKCCHTATVNAVHHGDDDLKDPFCDPDRPVVVTFQEVSAAAFRIQSGVEKTPCNVRRALPRTSGVTSNFALPPLASPCRKLRTWPGTLARWDPPLYSLLIGDFFAILFFCIYCLFWRIDVIIIRKYAWDSHNLQTVQSYKTYHCFAVKKYFEPTHCGPLLVCGSPHCRSLGAAVRRCVDCDCSSRHHWRHHFRCRPPSSHADLSS